MARARPGIAGCRQRSGRPAVECRPKKRREKVARKRGPLVTISRSPPGFRNRFRRRKIRAETRPDDWLPVTGPGPSATCDDRGAIHPAVRDRRTRPPGNSRRQIGEGQSRRLTRKAWLALPGAPLVPSLERWPQGKAGPRPREASRARAPAAFQPRVLGPAFARLPGADGARRAAQLVQLAGSLGRPPAGWQQGRGALRDSQRTPWGVGQKRPPLAGRDVLEPQSAGRTGKPPEVGDPGTAMDKARQPSGWRLPPAGWPAGD